MDLRPVVDGVDTQGEQEGEIGQLEVRGQLIELVNMPGFRTPHLLRLLFAVRGWIPQLDVLPVEDAVVRVGVRISDVSVDPSGQLVLRMDNKPFDLGQYS